MMGSEDAVLELISNLLYVWEENMKKLEKITFGLALLKGPLSSRIPELPLVKGLGPEV